MFFVWEYNINELNEITENPSMFIENLAKRINYTS